MKKKINQRKKKQSGIFIFLDDLDKNDKQLKFKMLTNLKTKVEIYSKFCILRAKYFNYDKPRPREMLYEDNIIYRR